MRTVVLYIIFIKTKIFIIPPIINTILLTFIDKIIWLFEKSLLHHILNSHVI